MAIQRIDLRFRDAAGVSRVLALNPGLIACEMAGITLSARAQPVEGGKTVQAAISNRSGGDVHLDSIHYFLATGFSPLAPSRFFKHGYQSWSGSRAISVGATLHPHATRDPLTRISHQSEAQRPEEALEDATSELFTIIESDSAGDLFVAGFTGAATQLSTITVNAPGQVHARGLFDGVTLRSGQTRDADPLAFWHSGKSAASNAARWAQMLGDAMHARSRAPYQRGWCSWYHYFHSITEETLMFNLRMLKDLRSEYPIEIVQLDDGYQEALGDWDRTNRKFPSGLKIIANEIRDAGFVAGLWTAPFLAARDSRIMRMHSNWFVTQDDEPLRCAHNANWTGGQDKFAYALDGSNPDFVNHLGQLFETIVLSYGYNYLKLDFLFAGAVVGKRYDPAVTRAETFRRGLEAIRRAAGNDAFILGCGCPLGPAVGIVDGMRIGPDVAPYWGTEEKGEPGTALAIDAVVTRSFMHRRLWLNDPDCLMRAKETGLSSAERLALAWTIAASGGMLLISDDMRVLGENSAELFRAVARIGAEVDARAFREPPMVATLMAPSGLKVMSLRDPDVSFHLLLNMGGEALNVSLSATIGPYNRATLTELTGETDAPDSLDIPQHTALLIRTN